MKYLISILTFFLLSNILATDLTLNFDAVSAYVYKGATYNDGLVLQPSIEVTNSPITIGGWINFDTGDYNGTLEANKLSEVDLYAFYDFTVSKIDFSAGYLIFTYPDSKYATEQEIRFNITYDTPIKPSLKTTYGVDGAISDNFYCGVNVYYKFEYLTLKPSLNSLITYSYPDEGNHGFSHYELSLGGEVIKTKTTNINILLTYIGLINEDVLPRLLTGGGYDTNVILKGSLSKSFK
jgi:hypothetical protein